MSKSLPGGTHDGERARARPGGDSEGEAARNLCPGKAGGGAAHRRGKGGGTPSLCSSQGRSQSAPPKDRDKNGGEAARGRGRQRINEAGRRKEGGSDALQQRSRSLVAKKDYRRSVVVSSVAPAGGVAITGCPARTDPQFDKALQNYSIDSSHCYRADQ